MTRQMAKHLVILSTCPDDTTAHHIAEQLVSERLAACVNRIPGLRSTYRWRGQVQDEPEVLLLIKTTEDRYPALEMRLKALHPYEVPEIIALPVIAGSATYLQWVSDGSSASAP